MSTTPCNYNLFVAITSPYYNYSRSIIGTVMEKSSTLDPNKIKITFNDSFAIFFMLQHFCTLTGRSGGMEKKTYCYYYTIIFFFKLIRPVRRRTVFLRCIQFIKYNNIIYNIIMPITSYHRLSVVAWRRRRHTCAA